MQLQPAWSRCHGISSDPWREPWPWEAGRMHTQGHWQHGHQGDVHHNGVHLLQRPAPVCSRCVHSSAKQSTHTQTQQHSHSTRFTQLHTTPGQGTWLHRMFNHVSSRKLFVIKRDYNRFHLTSKTFSTAQRCPLRSTSGTQQSGFKLQIHPLLKGGHSMQ